MTGQAAYRAALDELAHQVAAAVLIAMDADGRSHSWRIHGGGTGPGGHDTLTLAHDTWRPAETALPPESFATTTALRTLIAQWAFGETLPPPAVEWIAVRDVGWF